MDKIVINPAVGSQLGALEHPVELCDPSGRVLGWFQPAMEYEYYVPPFSEEELRAAEQEEGGRTLAEILADLEKRQ